MPFINERIAQREQQLQKERYEKAVARPSRFRFDPHAVMELLKARIVGQPHVLRAMEDMLLTVKADFNAAQRPLSVNLFLGPTGVGKTETVRVIAEAILGSTDKICRIDMNTLAQEHYTAALTGSPPGYVGSKEGQTLFNIEHIKGTFSEPGIVLFDEIEKASKDVVRAILNILDTGKLVLTSGVKELDFSNTLIFMTSNVGARELSDSIAECQTGWRRWLHVKPTEETLILERALTQHFDPEFLNRIDRAIAFNILETDFLGAVLRIELTKLNKRLSKRNAQLNIDEGAERYLLQYYDQRYGARGLARRLRVELEPLLARAIIDYPKHTLFAASIQHTALVVQPTLTHQQ